MPKNENKAKDSSKSIDNINKMIHEPARLLIMAHLYVVESADFTYLRLQTNLTWGNLSSHVSKLEEAGYVLVQKEFIKKKPRTMLSLSPEGRKAFEEYQQQMKQLLG